MGKKQTEKQNIKNFIDGKKIETIKEYVVAFHLDENMINPLGYIRIDGDLQNHFGIINNKTYDIYLKLKQPLSEDTFTRLILAKLCI